MEKRKVVHNHIEEPVAGYESQVVEWKETWRDEYT
jgi:hypothetical protein